eukprot:Hpha_TRINITY_DN16341_c1_g18::TRINITY_DN16341_c1_g18_i1::g.59792::m.59792
MPPPAPAPPPPSPPPEPCGGPMNRHDHVDYSDCVGRYTGDVCNVKCTQDYTGGTDIVLDCDPVTHEFYDSSELLCVRIPCSDFMSVWECEGRGNGSCSWVRLGKEDSAVCLDHHCLGVATPEICHTRPLCRWDHVPNACVEVGCAHEAMCQCAEDPQCTWDDYEGSCRSATGVAYVMIKADGKDWNSATTRCAVEGMELAVADTPEERRQLGDVIRRFFEDNPANVTECGTCAWVGGVRTDRGRWIWAPSGMRIVPKPEHDVLNIVWDAGHKADIEIKEIEEPVALCAGGSPGAHWSPCHSKVLGLPAACELRHDRVPPLPCPPLDVALVVDRSTSSRRRREWRPAVAGWVKRLSLGENGMRIGVVPGEGCIGDQCRLHTQYVNASIAVRNASISMAGHSFFGNGLLAAIEMLNKASKPDRRKFIVLITDGLLSDSDKVLLDARDRAIRGNIVINVVVPDSEFRNTVHTENPPYKVDILLEPPAPGHFLVGDVGHSLASFCEPHGFWANQSGLQDTHGLCNPPTTSNPTSEDFEPVVVAAAESSMSMKSMLEHFLKCLIVAATLLLLGMMVWGCFRVCRKPNHETAHHRHFRSFDARQDSEQYEHNVTVAMGAWNSDDPKLPLVSPSPVLSPAVKPTKNGSGTDLGPLGASLELSEVIPTDCVECSMSLCKKPVAVLCCMDGSRVCNHLVHHECVRSRQTCPKCDSDFATAELVPAPDIATGRWVEVMFGESKPSRGDFIACLSSCVDADQKAIASAVQSKWQEGMDADGLRSLVVSTLSSVSSSKKRSLGNPTAKLRPRRQGTLENSHSYGMGNQGVMPRRGSDLAAHTPSQASPSKRSSTGEDALAATAPPRRDGTTITPIRSKDNRRLPATGGRGTSRQLSSRASPHRVSASDAAVFSSVEDVPDITVSLSEAGSDGV